MNEQKSEQYSLNRHDWKKAAKSALVWFAPVLLFYVSAVLGALQADGHHFRINDLIPTQFVIDAAITWLFMQFQGLLMRFVQGDKK